MYRKEDCPSIELLRVNELQQKIANGELIYGYNFELTSFVQVQRLLHRSKAPPWRLGESSLEISASIKLCEWRRHGYTQQIINSGCYENDHDSLTSQPVADTGHHNKTEEIRYRRIPTRLSLRNKARYYDMMIYAATARDI